ncbi:ABC transporter [Microbacterium sp.]|uniref:ABC transporter n=1 Tax=Microbacterium sp. TaxID=51671 RepID=UPI002812241A|nr:ABC transporter [Microbacterium sp.]
MSDPEVPQHKQPHDVDHVVGSANEGLDAAAAARAEVPGPNAERDTVDPDLAAFEEAEREHPGTFSSSGDDRDAGAAPGSAADGDVLAADQREADVDAADERAAADRAADERAAADRAADERAAADARAVTDARAATDADAETSVLDRPHHHSVADTAYAASAPDAHTRVVPAEPLEAPVAAPAPQPIFVQAPEPPRELNNRGAAGGIGLVATLCFALLLLGAILGLGALEGEVTTENIADAALAPLTTWSFWVPVVVFFLSFWLLGAFINRGRWGKWVIFGLFVAAATYGGYLLGQLFQAPFWRIPPTEAAELVNEQLFAPLAIAAFLFARELTIWFGAWVARSGARKKALNAEAQAEYERTLEAGPAALR